MKVLDVTNVLVFPEDVEGSEDGVETPGPPLLGGNGTLLLPLADLKYLNLTGALLNMDSPMEHLAFDSMPSLQVRHCAVEYYIGNEKGFIMLKAENDKLEFS